MKKSIFIAILGAAAVAATSSYGQGSTFFSSYTANHGVGATTAIFGSGVLLPAGYTAQLYYALGTVSDPVNMTIATGPGSITSPVTGLTLLAGAVAAYDNSGAAVGAPGLGYFDGGVVAIPGYTSGAVTFEVVATGPNDVGRSGSWTETQISGNGLPAGNFGDFGVMPNFLVAPVPEPTTLALVGLGSLALVALRRKQS